MSVCYNCFIEKSGNYCPRCGYQNGSLAEKYPLALREGSVLAGKYVVGKPLGQGGFGITYVAQDYNTKEIVAIKEFFPEAFVTRRDGISVSAFNGEKEENFVYGKKCFMNEAKTLGRFIGNDSIVEIKSYFEENNTAYFVMEFIRGDSFFAYIKKNGNRISWQETKKLLLPVVDALAIVHSKGIIHRDISPDNIFITDDGKVKIIDFGAARFSTGDKSQSLDVVLKHGFAPQEQYARHGRQGPFTDVYALAATMYRACTGEAPPDSVDRIYEDTIQLPSSLGVDISPDDEAALMQALAVRYTERFSDMNGFRNALTIRFIEDNDPYRTIPVNGAYGSSNSANNLLYKFYNNTAYVVGLSGYRVTEVEIPSEVNGCMVVAIEESAFKAQKYLRKVVIPDSVTVIRAFAFLDCESLEEVNIPYGINYIEWGTFSGCIKLESVEIPETVTMLDGYAFYGCRSLKSVVIPDNVTDIRDYAFCMCENIESVKMPRDVNLGDYVFDEELDLFNTEKPAVHMNYSAPTQRPSNALEYEQFLQASVVRECFDKNAEEIIIPETYCGKPVIRIRDYAFRDCKKLRRITIPDSVIEIGEFAFLECESLCEINLPPNIKSISWGTFSGCSSLRRAKLPDDLKEIGDYAFFNCASLYDVNIPKNLKRVGDYAFSGTKIIIK